MVLPSYCHTNRALVVLLSVVPNATLKCSISRYRRTQIRLLNIQASHVRYRESVVIIYDLMLLQNVSLMTPNADYNCVFQRGK